MEVTYTEPRRERRHRFDQFAEAGYGRYGATVKVPLFINTGDKIRVDTRTREYNERIKE